jgi:hypothetical protein
MGIVQKYALICGFFGNKALRESVYFHRFFGALRVDHKHKLNSTLFFVEVLKTGYSDFDQLVRRGYDAFQLERGRSSFRTIMAGATG